jgi:hypothetical protein
MSDQERSVTCATCGRAAGSHGHMCVPVEGEDERCDWCGAVIVTQRHLCSAKVQELKYVCNSCGRTAVSAEMLCEPVEVASSSGGG